MSKQYINGQLMFDTDYSTSEVKTGATWTDGKPIYSRVVELTSPSTSGTWGNYPHGISNIATIVSYSALVYQTVNVYPVPFYIGTSASFNIAMTTSGIALLPVGSENTSRPVKVIVYYTKTTD